MKRTIILVEMPWSRDKDPRIPLGHASLLASLRQEPCLNVKSVVIPIDSGHVTAEMVAETILVHTRGLPATAVDVALGAYVWNDELLRNVLTTLRNCGFAGRIVLGGPQISNCGTGLEEIYPEAQTFVRGNGEAALVAIAKNYSPIVIPGVHWAGEKDQLIQTSVDLSMLPSPWLAGHIDLEGQHFVRWETQRGCPFQCAFCQHRDAGGRQKQRQMDMARIEAEIDSLCRHKVEDIAVLDPIFNTGPHATVVLERFVANRFSGRLSLQCRAEMVNKTFLDVASKLHVRLEFGLQTIHQDEARVIQRQNCMNKVDRVLADVQRRGIEHEVSIIYGLPLQTLKSFKETISWCLERHVPVIKAFPLLLLRGTALDIERERWGLEVSGDWKSTVVQSSTFTRQDWTTMNLLSTALSNTERHHPVRIDDLCRLASDIQPSAQD